MAPHGLLLRVSRPLLPVLPHPRGGRIAPPLVALDELPERVRVAPLGGLHQRPIVESFWRRHPVVSTSLVLARGRAGPSAYSSGPGRPPGTGPRGAPR